VYSTGRFHVRSALVSTGWMSLQGVVAIKAFRIRCCVDGMTSDGGTRRLGPYLIASLAWIAEGRVAWRTA
jgi:hypothetical protein